MLWAPHKGHRPQMPGSRTGDRATKRPCHPRAGSLLRQEQGQGLNYLSPTSSVCWEANKRCRGFTWLTSLVPRSPTAFPLTTGPAHCPRRRLAVIQARILGQPSPAVPRKRPSGAGSELCLAAGRARLCPVTRRDGLSLSLSLRPSALSPVNV